MSKRFEDTKQVTAIIEKSHSIAEVIRSLGLIPSGGNYKTIYDFIARNHIDISHFTGQGWNVGQKFKPQKTFSDDEIFISNSPYRCNRRLKERLFSSGKKQRICESCGNAIWLGKPISLEVHHINGDNTDNRLSNLQVLCPNCHAQTDHYRGRAKQK